MTDESQPLVEQWRPTTWDGIQGNNKSLRQLRQWANKWSKGETPEPQLLVGPPGVGKTTTAQVMSNEMGWPIEEVNASDARKTDDIAKIVERMKVKPIDAQHQIILLDEADSIPGSTNIKPLKKLLKDPPNPILVVANEEWEIPNGIKNNTNTHKFKLSSSSRMAKLKEIVKEGDFDLDMQEIAELAERKNLRDAIQDLQAIGEDGELFSDDRKYGSSPFDVLDDIRTGKGFDGQPDMTPDELQRWLVDGLSGRYEGWEAQVVWDLLARADIQLERAYTEDYRFWKYASILQEEISDVRLTDPYTGYVRYGSPNYVKAPSPKSDSSTKAALFRELAEVKSGRFGIASNFHEFRHHYLPILLDLPTEERRQLVIEHGLSDKAMKALEIDPDRQEDWATDDGEQIEEQSVFDW